MSKIAVRFNWKVFLTLGILFLSTELFAQVPQLVRRAYELASIENYEEARSAIDLAVQDEITGKNPQAWYLRSFIYKELFFKESEGGDPKKANSLRNSSIYSAEQGIELDVNNEYTPQCKEILNLMYGTILQNEGAVKMQQGKFREAIQAIRYYIDGLGEDAPNYTDAIFYMGYGYSNLGMVDSAAVYYEKARELNYPDPLVYYNLSIIYENRRKEKESIDVINEGIEKFPDEVILYEGKITILLSFNKLENVEPLIKTYVEKFDETADAMLVIGTIYERLENQFPNQKDKYFGLRVQALERALALDPNDFTANYNLGIAYFNKGVDIVKKAEYDLDLEKVMMMLEEVAQLFENAKPYMEKAHRINATNTSAMKALEGIYYQLGEDEKYEAIKKKLMEAGGN